MKYEPDMHLAERKELPMSLQDVLELAAARVHDVWAAGKAADGWRWGEKLDEEKKQHPCLVSYEDLTEHDREYDRRTAAATIWCLLEDGVLNVPE